MPPSKRRPQAKVKPHLQAAENYQNRLFIAYPHPGSVSHVFLEGILQTLLKPDRKFHCSFSHARSGPLISRARNKLSEAFLQSDCTHLMFIDTDMHFESSDIQTLIDADKPIVAGLCYGLMSENPETFVAALTYKGTEVLTPVPKEELPEQGSFEVDAVGMAFTLIKREVMEALGADNIKLWPFAETIVGTRAVGEDVTFCLRAKEKGYQTWVCVDARIGHEKSVLI